MDVMSHLQLREAYELVAILNVIFHVSLVSCFHLDARKQTKKLHRRDVSGMMRAEATPPEVVIYYVGLSKTKTCPSRLEW
jgi:hypothetical protein